MTALFLCFWYIYISSKRQRSQALLRQMKTAEQPEYICLHAKIQPQNMGAIPNSKIYIRCMTMALLCRKTGVFSRQKGGRNMESRPPFLYIPAR